MILLLIVYKIVIKLLAIFRNVIFVNLIRCSSYMEIKKLIKMDFSCSSRVLVTKPTTFFLFK